MKRKSPGKHWGLTLCVAAYLIAVWWVFTKSTPLTNEREITIRIAHWQIELGPPDGIQAAIDRYEELNPNVRVKQLLVPGAVYRQWMRANFAGNSAPDIVEYGAGLAGLSDLPVRYFEPLTEELLMANPYNTGTELEGLPWMKTFLDELMEQRMNSPEPGQYYAVTLAQGSERLFVNRELLAEVTGSSERVKDFAAMREVFKQTAAYGEEQGRMIKPFSGSKDNTVWMMQFFMKGIANKLSQSLDNYGLLSMPTWQTQWKYLNGEWDFQDPTFLAGFRLLSEVEQQMRPGYMGFLRDDAVRQFLGKEVLFMFAGTWDATTLRRLADFPVDAWRCPQPSTSDPVVGEHMLGHYADGTSSTGIAFYLNKRSSQKEAAIDFLRFLTSYEGNKLFTDNSGWPPSVKTVPVAPEIASFISPEDGYMYYGPNFSIGGGTRDLFRKNLHLLSGPEGSVEKLATALDEQMPEVVRSALADHERSARWAVLPQDARIVAYGGLRSGDPDDPTHAVRQERLEAAQNLSEARALLIARQLELTADFGRN